MSAKYFLKSPIDHLRKIIYFPKASLVVSETCQSTAKGWSFSWPRPMQGALTPLRPPRGARGRGIASPPPARMVGSASPAGRGTPVTVLQTSWNLTALKVGLYFKDLITFSPVLRLCVCIVLLEKDLLISWLVIYKFHYDNIKTVSSNSGIHLYS